MTEQVSTTPPDWTLIEADYRAGIKSLRTIAEEHGITHPAITKRAKRDKWPRDLTAKTRARADALVSKAAVSSEVSTATKATETAVVEANATLQYQVRIRHRKDITGALETWSRLSAELDASGLSKEQIESLLASQTDLTARQRDAMRQTLARVAATPGRISSFNTLVHSLERLVKLERQAFGISSEEEAEGNPGTPAAAAASMARGLTDAERAIRLARLLKMQPGLLGAVESATSDAQPKPAAPSATAAPTAAPGATAAPAVPVPPDRE
jgi:hypothetical protein